MLTYLYICLYVLYVCLYVSMHAYVHECAHVCVCVCTRWFKYDRDKLWLVYTLSVPVIFEPPCICVCTHACYVCMDGCAYIFTYVYRVYVCMPACLYVYKCMFLCMYLCAYVCICVWVNIYVSVYVSSCYLMWHVIPTMMLKCTDIFGRLFRGVEMHGCPKSRKVISDFW
jgi:nuclear pore complex protein Nup62